MKFKDVGGDELTIQELVGRLQYRLKHPVETAPLGVDENLNLFVCWRWHVREGTRRSTRCPKCKSVWVYQIKNGILMRLSSGNPPAMQTDNPQPEEELVEDQDW